MKIKIISVFIFISLFWGININAQTNYYYHKGKRIYLPINYESVSIVTDHEGIAPQFIKSTSFPVTLNRENYISKSLIKIDSLKASRHYKRKAGEVKLKNIINDEEYFSLIKEFQLQPNIIKVAPAFKSADGREILLTNNFYVKLFHESDIFILADLAAQYSIEIIGFNEYMPLWFTLSCEKVTPYNAMEAANLFYESNLFAATEPELLSEYFINSNDTYFSYQWGLSHTGQNGWSPRVDIKAEEAWKITTGTADIKVAIYDSGIEQNHPDLKDNIYGRGFDAHSGSRDAVLRDRHGTACAGIVGARQNNGIGISGVAPNTSLIDISMNLGEGVKTSAQEIADGFSWGRNNGVDIFSCSWGGGEASSILDDAIGYATTLGRYGKGCVVVFASGNKNSNRINVPAMDNNRVIVVGAMSPCGQRATSYTCDRTDWSEVGGGSSYGTRLDIVAPGAKISTTDLQGEAGYIYGDYNTSFAGTSAACPHVAGVAALMLSVSPDLTAAQVKDILESTTSKVGSYSYQTISGRANGTWNNEMGYGLVNSHAAVVKAVSMYCPTRRLLGSPITFDITYQANRYIHAYCSIDSNVSVTLKANQVCLQPGFSFKAGSQSKFIASPEGCTIDYVYNNENFADKVDYLSYQMKTKENSENEKENDSRLGINISFDNATGLITAETDQGEFKYAELFNLESKKLAHFQSPYYYANHLNLSPGIYFLRIYVDEKMEVHKIVVNNR